MATKVFRGDAPSTAQVNTVTPANVGIGNTFTMTVNEKSITVTATAATVANVVGLAVAAWNASTEPEFAEVTASDSTTHVTLTADTKGKPFTQTSSASGGTATFTTATTVTSSGPSHWDIAANWSPSGVPADADDVYIENNSVDILYGLNQTAIELTSLNIAASYTGKIGLPNINGTYREYREKYLVIGATTINVGYGDGAGSGRIKINCEAEATTLNVSKTGPPAEQGVPALLFVGTEATNVLNVTEGNVGVAIEAGQTSTLATVRCGFEQSVSSDVTLRLGSGCTLTTINQSGGALEINSAFTTLNKLDGTTIINGVGTKTTISVDGGSLVYNSTGTITTLTVGSGGKVDFGQDQRAKTVTNKVNLYEDSTLLDPNGVVTFSGGFQTHRCKVADVTVDFGVNRSYTVA
jgi:hypothetical protein